MSCWRSEVKGRARGWSPCEEPSDLLLLLLQVNDVQLYGKSRREVISFLKEVPPPFTLVCCRHPASFDLLQYPEDSESEEEPEPAQRRAPPRVEQVEQVREVEEMGKVREMEQIEE